MYYIKVMANNDSPSVIYMLLLLRRAVVSRGGQTKHVRKLRASASHPSSEAAWNYQYIPAHPFGSNGTLPPFDISPQHPVFLYRQVHPLSYATVPVFKNRRWGRHSSYNHHLRIPPFCRFCCRLAPVRIFCFGLHLPQFSPYCSNYLHRPRAHYTL